MVLGHLAPPFLALLDFAKSRFARLRLPPYWQLGLGGLVVGVISIFVPQVWGNGYSVVGSILHGQLVGVWLLSVLVAKVVATSATVGSRAVGGVFTPTLFIGCAVGALFGGLLHQALPHFTSQPAAYALVGMGGFLAATTHAPLTSILMLFEMTADYQIVLPLMLTCVVAHFTAKVYRGGESIYHASLTQAFTAHGGDDWRLRTIQALVKPVAVTTAPTQSLQELFAALPQAPGRAGVRDRGRQAPRLARSARGAFAVQESAARPRCDRGLGGTPGDFRADARHAVVRRAGGVPARAGDRAARDTRPVAQHPARRGVAARPAARHPGPHDLPEIPKRRRRHAPAAPAVW